PEGVYKNTTPEKVRNALIFYCNEKGLMVLQADTGSVICGKQQSGGAAILSQFAIGNSYSTAPMSKVRFTVSPINDDVKVWADMWVETQMATGQVQQMSVTDNASKNVIQQRLDELKP
ncbi:hypothetical protein Q4R95_19020, partial [Morganella morganii]